MAVTILVPTYNMAEYLAPLAESFLRAGLLNALDEIIFVDDGSVDTTPQVLKDLAHDSRFEGKLRVLRLEPNRGRFTARFEGAQMAKSEWILFLDSRLQVQPDFSLNLHRALKRGGSTVGWVDTDVTKNLFCLYWQRSHETAFKRHYQIAQPMLLTAQNYDKYLKGTGVFLCKREHFLEVCELLQTQKILSDDTLLLRELIELAPMHIDPALRVDWEPRANLRDFLARFFERGPGFVEYHVFTSPGRYAVAVMFALFALAALVGYGLREPSTALTIALALLPFIALTALPFGKTWGESLRLMPLHLLVILFFGFGVLKGLAIYSVRSLRPAKLR